MKVWEGFDGREFFENFRDFWPYGYKIDMANLAWRDNIFDMYVYV